ncbi:hypothetical protein ACFRCW_11500 [Streptomyces sp. NPDC056653]|uniref:HNH endonuclease n=1 Tax=Streptomyces sp. NPDC056653 TaxID=3345894 RepID=UPI00369CADF0
MSYEQEIGNSAGAVYDGYLQPQFDSDTPSGPTLDPCHCSRTPDANRSVRKLADLSRPGRRDKPAWVHLMAMRRRKTLVICRRCHEDIHAGRPTAAPQPEAPRRRPTSLGGRSGETDREQSRHRAPGLLSEDDQRVWNSSPDVGDGLQPAQPSVFGYDS